MRLSLKKIKHQPALTEEHRICERLPVPVSLEYHHFNLPEPVCFCGKLTNKGGGLFTVEGHYQTQVGLCCSRCLSSFEVPVSGDIYAIYGTDVKDDFDGEVTIRDFHGDAIDISELLMDEIAFALPMQPLCSDDCQGLCTICGADLNLRTCFCTRDKTDPRWEKLANFKSDRKAKKGVTENGCT